MCLHTAARFFPCDSGAEKISRAISITWIVFETHSTAQQNKPMKRVLGLLLGAVVALLPAVVGAAGGRIVVASKIDNEGALLGNMIVPLLEARGLAVDNKLQLGPTNILRAAILAGQIDLYPEYTGN